MKSYFIFTPNWTNISAGTIVLHKFAQKLYRRLKGFVYVSSSVQQPGYDRIPTINEFKGDKRNTIAIYPEIVNGNPFECEKVVRYLLYFPGELGGPKTFSSSDIIFSYTKKYNVFNLPEERILYLSHIYELDIFYDMNLPRDKEFFFRKASTKKPLLELEGISFLGTDWTGREKQIELAKKLNQCKILYCYDNYTAMVLIARLCGCPVLQLGSISKETLLNSESWYRGIGYGKGLEEKNWAISSANGKFIASCLKADDVYFDDVLLPRFIKITQKG